MQDNILVVEDSRYSMAINYDHEDDVCGASHEFSICRLKLDICSCRVVDRTAQYYHTTQSEI